MNHRINIPSLTGLRFLAAFLVLLAHSMDQAFAPYGVAAISKFTGCMAFFGMSIFFTLSGFVLVLNYYHGLSEEKSNKKEWFIVLYNFIVARFARIMPAYFIAGLIFLGCTPLSETVRSNMKFYLLGIQSWIGCTAKGDFMFMHFYPHSWSISTEWFFYLVFPIFCLLIPRKLTIKKIIFIAVLIYVSAIIFFSFYRQGILHWGDVSPENQAAWLKWFTYFSPFGRLCEFLLGAVCGLFVFKSESLIKAGTAIGVNKARIVLITCIVLFVLIADFAGSRIALVKDERLAFFGPSLLNAPFVAIFLLVIALNPKSVWNVFEKNLMMKGGELSYSLYLFHLIITVHFAGSIINLGQFFYYEAIYRMLVMMTLSMFVALGSYQLIEVPSRAFIRKLCSIKR